MLLVDAKDFMNVSLETVRANVLFGIMSLEIGSELFIVAACMSLQIGECKVSFEFVVSMVSVGFLRVAFTQQFK